MKLLLVSLALLLLLVTACSNELPPEPNAPGIAGNYYRAVGAWGVESDTFAIDITDSTIELSVDGDDYVYKNLYVWHEGETRWAPLSFVEDTVSDSKWIANSASLSLNINSYQGHKDSEDEIYFVAYSCSKDGTYWDCNENKWQIQIEKLGQSAAPELDEDVIVNPIIEDTPVEDESVAPKDFPSYPPNPNSLN